MCPLVESQAVPSEIPSLSSKAVATAAQKKPLFVALNSRSAIVLYVPTPQITRLDTGKRRLVRELHENRRRTQVPRFLHIGSPGAVGRHNHTPNRVAFGAVP